MVDTEGRRLKLSACSEAAIRPAHDSFLSRYVGAEAWDTV